MRCENYVGLRDDHRNLPARKVHAEHVQVNLDDCNHPISSIHFAVILTYVVTVGLV